VRVQSDSITYNSGLWLLQANNEQAHNEPNQSTSQTSRLMWHPNQIDYLRLMGCFDANQVMVEPISG
jgi:hypothetical protein